MLSALFLTIDVEWQIFVQLTGITVTYNALGSIELFVGSDVTVTALFDGLSLRTHISLYHGPWPKAA